MYNEYEGTYQSAGEGVAHEFAVFAGRMARYGQ